jgi:hypothetical protein
LIQSGFTLPICRLTHPPGATVASQFVYHAYMLKDKAYSAAFDGLLVNRPPPLVTHIPGGWCHPKVNPPPSAGMPVMWVMAKTAACLPGLLLCCVTQAGIHTIGVKCWVIGFENILELRVWLGVSGPTVTQINSCLLIVMPCCGARITLPCTLAVAVSRVTLGLMCARVLVVCQATACNATSLARGCASQFCVVWQASEVPELS